MTLKEIYKKIVNDPANAEFTKAGFKPLYTVNKHAKIVIIGQAPGIKAMTKHKVFADKSGDTLREWLGVTRDEFYNEENFAIIPMDFYYPGKAKTGDLPPRPFFASTYHPLLLANMPNVKLIILSGNYALKYYLGATYLQNLTNTVKNYKAYLPTYFPLVHPSPLNFRWHNKNPWFNDHVVPQLKTLVHNILNDR